MTKENKLLTTKRQLSITIALSFLLCLFCLHSFSDKAFRNSVSFSNLQSYEEIEGIWRADSSGHIKNGKMIFEKHTPQAIWELTSDGKYVSSYGDKKSIHGGSFIIKKDHFILKSVYTIDYIIIKLTKTEFIVEHIKKNKNNLKEGGWRIYFSRLN